jgi:hypothetical protein
MARLPAKAFHLEPDVEVLWKRWVDARNEHIVHPTPTRLDARLEALKAFYLLFAGQHGLETALADERRRGEAALVTGCVTDSRGAHEQR